MEPQTGSAFVRTLIIMCLGALLAGLIWNQSYTPLAEELVEPIVEPQADTILTMLDMTSIVYFDLNSTVVADSNLSTLIEIAQQSAGNIYLYGFTDDLGGEKYNIELSEARAKSVGNKLIYMGYDAGKIFIVPRGEEAPVKYNTTEENRKFNRRVVIKWIKPQ